jgi:hypothetical protein
MVFGSDVISFGPSGLRMLWSEIVVQFCFRSLTIFLKSASISDELDIEVF